MDSGLTCILYAEALGQMQVKHSKFDCAIHRAMIISGSRAIGPMPFPPFEYFGGEVDATSLPVVGIGMSNAFSLHPARMQKVKACL